MSTSANNKTLNASKTLFVKTKERQVMAAMNEIAKDLLSDALDMRSGWLGFTGNLPTSYTVGVWGFDKSLTLIHADDVQGGYSATTVKRAKVEKDELVFLSHPWEGDMRRVRGQVEITDPSGIELAKQFLMGYKPNTYPAIVLCTGAEYSRYLEESKHANVLSESADPTYVRRISDRIFVATPIK